MVILELKMVSGNSVRWVPHGTFSNAGVCKIVALRMGFRLDEVRISDTTYNPNPIAETTRNKEVFSDAD